jgi:hypothetical protein
MKRTVIAALLLRFSLGGACFAQASLDHSNEWQKQVSPLKSEPTDERSRTLLKERGAYFDQFAPKTPGGYYPVGSRGEMPELPTMMSDAIVIGKFSDHVVHLSPSGRSVYTELIFTPSTVIAGGPGNIHVGASFSVLESGGAVLKPAGEIVRSPITPTEFGLIPGKTYVLFLGYLPASEAYELFKTWDVTSGFAVPNSPEDVEAGRRNRSKNVGVPVDTLIAHIKEMLAKR